MKIFDCTTFYSEHLMMDIRFNVLNEKVDKFIVVESKYSHSGKEKNLNFDINNYKKFKDKIVYLVIDKEPDDIVKDEKKITSEIKRPITCIIGGSKVSTKINVIKSLITKFDNIIIVGGMANNIIKYMGNNIGKSLQEDQSESTIKEIFSLAKKESCKIIYPKDVVVAKDLNGSPVNKESNEIMSDEMILDIGPKTIDIINDIINNSKTILWNGPAGYFENPSFANGSIKIAKRITENNKSNKIYSVVGGGDTVSLLNSLDVINDFNFVSTAGGAFLEYLEGKELPGIKALN